MRLMIALCVAVSLLKSGDFARAAQDDSDPRVIGAVELGLAFLARHQQDDGAIHDGGPKLASTGLALLAFLSSGNTPELGRYGLHVRRASDYLVQAVPQDGYIGRADGSRMYGQGIVTLALAQAYGVEPDASRRVRIHQAVQRAVWLILKAQEVHKPPPHAGGWRYEPQSADSDLSLSGWNVLALRSARSIGIEVPQESFDRALAYAGRCYREDQGGFAYQPRSEVTAATNAVGIVTMGLLSGSMDRAEIASAARLLLERPVNEQTRFSCYATYYTVRAALLLNREDVWAGVWNATRERLLASQQGDGGWPASRSAEEPGRVYATSMSVLALIAPRSMLPGEQP
ncbi:prenyltransferase/squalene oxidase repeat-containing protein [Fontivita pretiosa]|uniref:prenyltransferase/squalene oxidase repeat-containing protein n=1 Tax=Fontivita pretiosa TaxID=2989684 RepID=UPI003D171871